MVRSNATVTEACIGASARNCRARDSQRRRAVAVPRIWRGRCGPPRVVPVMHAQPRLGFCCKFVLDEPPGTHATLKAEREATLHMNLTSVTMAHLTKLEPAAWLLADEMLSYTGRCHTAVA